VDRQGEGEDDVEMTRRSVQDVTLRAGLSGEQAQRVLSLDLPADSRVVWDRLATLGVTQESLVGRMGGSP